MRIRNGRSTAILSPQGGSILSWQWRDELILGPSRVVMVGDVMKDRGETHWCYPNYGSVPEGVLRNNEKHGYLRSTLLDPVFFGQSSSRFKLSRQTSGDFSEVTVDVSLKDAVLKNTLTVKNHGAERLPLLVANHPYFAVSHKGLQVMMGGQKIGQVNMGFGTHSALNISAEARVYQRTDNPVVCIAGVGDVHIMASENCTHFVVWSDSPREYVCVEPIFGKPKTYGTEEGVGLDPRETFEASVEYIFEPTF